MRKWADDFNTKLFVNTELSSEPFFSLCVYFFGLAIQWCLN